MADSVAVPSGDGDLMEAVRTKYPRTPHLPWSLGISSDDRLLSDVGLHVLSNAQTVVTEKMDGGNVTLMRDCFYARSVDSGTPAWEKYAKAEWARMAHEIPVGWRVSAESMWAQRSVPYTNLDGPLLVFAIWNNRNIMLSWDDTVTWATLLGLPTVPVLGSGTGLEYTHQAWANHHDENVSEGYVVRDRGSFPDYQFAHRIAKYVRANHVRTEASWRRRTDFVTNGFKGN